MKKISFALPLFLLLFVPHSAGAQCCCSAVRFSLIDRQGKPLSPDTVRVKEITDRVDSRRAFIDGRRTDGSEVTFQIGCGAGDEVLSVIYKGAEMRIHFKFQGEFGHADGKITFRKGDFIAEPGERGDSASRTYGIRVRKATPGELNRPR